MCYLAFKLKSMWYASVRESTKKAYRNSKWQAERVCGNQVCYGTGYKEDTQKTNYGLQRK